MYPDNVPLLGKGQLFLKAPDGNEIELRYTGAQITPQEEPQPHDPETHYINPHPQLPEITIDLEPSPEFNAWLQGMVQAYKDWMQQKVDEYIQDMMHWAMENRPKWCQILRRTKKGRTRKKYAQRILQAYRKELASRD